VLTAQDLQILDRDTDLTLQSMKMSLSEICFNRFRFTLVSQSQETGGHGGLQVSTSFVIHELVGRWKRGGDWK